MIINMTLCTEQQLITQKSVNPCYVLFLQPALKCFIHPIEKVQGNDSHRYFLTFKKNYIYKTLAKYIFLVEENQSIEVIFWIETKKIDLIKTKVLI